MIFHSGPPFKKTSFFWLLAICYWLFVTGKLNRFVKKHTKKNQGWWLRFSRKFLGFLDEKNSDQKPPITINPITVLP
jgi:hypothetical protein